MTVYQAAIVAFDNCKFRSNKYLDMLHMRFMVAVYASKIGPNAPPFVGNNYYCESGYNGTDYPSSVLYTSDPLWDGEQCGSEGSCCSTAPWFTVDLVNPTSDDIEVCICSNRIEIEEDTAIQLLELYVQ